MKKQPILLLASLLALSILVIGIVSNATNNGDIASREIPTLKVGDKWVTEYITFTFTKEVTEEDTIDGKDCYVMECSYNPSIVNGCEDMETILYVNKTTYDYYKIHTMGTVNGEPISTVITNSYEYPEEPYWPLEVGKEVKRVKTVTTAQTYMGETVTGTVTETRILKIEQLEEITVEAGTFNCFKIVEYDEYGNKHHTYWYSDTVKQIIKEMVVVVGIIAELKSYSVH